MTHIQFGEKFTVDLDKHYCSCNFWELIGIPCRHSVAGICARKEEPESYVHQYYKRDAYVRTYSPEISAINGPKMWPQVPNVPNVLPPQYKRGAGRTKKLRRKEPDEPTNATKAARGGHQNNCMRCGKLGHNVRTCKNTPLEGYVPRKVTLIL